jgi:hypothetical protein
MDQVSEIEVSDAGDVVATIDGLPKSAGGSSWLATDGPIVVHFGDADFGGKYDTLLDDIGQWRAAAGRIESVDLRFSREAVVNPEITAVASSSDLAAASAAPSEAAAQPAARKHARIVRSPRARRKQARRHVK